MRRTADTSLGVGGGEFADASQPPDEDVGDAVRGVQFAPFDGLLEQGIGVVASALGLVQGGGEGVPAGLDELSAASTM